MLNKADPGHLPQLGPVAMGPVSPVLLAKRCCQVPTNSAGPGSGPEEPSRCPGCGG